MMDSDQLALIAGAVLTGNVSAYLVGRVAGARWMGERIKDVANGIIRRHYPLGNIPTVDASVEPIAVMCQTLDSLVESIDNSLERRNPHGK